MTYYNAIVRSKVLDEGVDVPDAQLGIILSGTGSGKEFVQRLGRLLRSKSNANKKAKLIEITSTEPREIGTQRSKEEEGNEDMTGNNNKEEDVYGGKDHSSSSTVNNNNNTIRSAASSVYLEELENIAEIRRRSGY